MIQAHFSFVNWGMDSLNFVNVSNVVGGLAQCSYAYNFSHLPTEKVCLSEMNISQAASVSIKRNTAVNEMDNLLISVANSRDRVAFQEL